MKLENRLVVVVMLASVLGVAVWMHKRCDSIPGSLACPPWHENAPSGLGIESKNDYKYTLIFDEGAMTQDSQYLTNGYEIEKDLFISFKVSGRNLRIPLRRLEAIIETK
jgi:hypothetical protein